MVPPIVDVRGEWDADGYHLCIETDKGESRFRVTDVPTARKLLSEVSRLRGYIAENDPPRTGRALGDDLS